MTTPSFTPVPAAQDRAVRAQLGEQAQAVQGQPSAGIFGDKAGRELPPQQMDLSAAKPVSADPAELLAALQRQQQQIDQLLAERAAAAPAAPELPDIEPRLSNASGELKAALGGLHARMLRIEEELGVDAAQELADK